MSFALTRWTPAVAQQVAVRVQDRGVGIRYRKSLGFGPFRLNLSKSGLSTSLRLGPMTINSRGRRTVHVGPGMSYVSYAKKPHPSRRQAAPTHTASPPPVAPAGWYPDPHDANVVRWWDGAHWTAATRAG